MNWGLVLGLWLVLAGIPVWAQADLVCDPGRQWQVQFGAQTQIGEQVFRLEVARTAAEQAQGLMYRTQLPPDQGMVFVIDPPQPMTFWMWNTCLNLDIIFLRHGRVIHIAENVPPCRQQPCPLYSPGSQSVDQVVELKGGTARRLNLAVGDPLPVTFRD
ncbi:MAG: DUF192 domain-containing protein [Thermostichales cyanobacterium SZTDM-1c_bins_54]